MTTKILNLPSAHQRVRGMTRVALLVLLLTACIPRYGDVDPTKPPYHCTTNPTSWVVTIHAEGRFPSEMLGRPTGATISRTIDKRRAKPYQRVCYSWPWVSREGRVIIMAGQDTVSVGPWFDPWVR